MDKALANARLTIKQAAARPAVELAELHARAKATLSSELYVHRFAPLPLYGQHEQPALACASCNHRGGKSLLNVCSASRAVGAVIKRVGATHLLSFAFKRPRTLLTFKDCLTILPASKRYSAVRGALGTVRQELGVTSFSLDQPLVTQPIVNVLSEMYSGNDQTLRRLWMTRYLLRWHSCSLAHIDSSERPLRIAIKVGGQPKAKKARVEPLEPQPLMPDAGNDDNGADADEQEVNFEEGSDLAAELARLMEEYDEEEEARTEHPEEEGSELTAELTKLMEEYEAGPSLGVSSCRMCCLRKGQAEGLIS